ncbi:dopamine receptor 2-like [Zeugodacus cucurbitae]|uniref:dopamine receptor 2-like n=1 Tax=Zeugodacus cucurbitae TaxID=28588 RepID=UPI0023D8F593|nr:dopamine receptor 2-like [Zeugodacus cucurbitae]XP_054091883.1 dopamine receptor 2-like [Zeugodacus cucurbitae]
MIIRPSATNSDDDDLLAIVWAISAGAKSSIGINSLRKIANNVPLMMTRNGIYNRMTQEMPQAMYYTANNYNNNNNRHYDTSNNSAQLLHTPTTATATVTTLTDSPHTSTVMYYEPNLEVINRSLLLTTAVSANATPASDSNNNSPLQTVFMANTTNNITTAIDADEEWARFYDLMLSWQGICLIAVFSTFIVVTIIGNTLVILAVITTRRLKTVTNCFVMSLAIADLLVGIFVMPPAVAVHLIGSWRLGWVLCDIWISLDVLLCTASILSLCAISVDRYLAVTQPLTYSRRRRSKRLAFIMILVVWVLALAITCPPMLGWYEPGRRDLSECRYNQNEGYVIFSAMGSFFIPMAVMIYVYARISCVIASRHDHMTDISVHNKKFKRYTAADVENDIDHDFSEQELSSGQRKQAAARTFSNQTIAKELHDVMQCEGETGGATTTAATGSGGGGGSSPHCHSLLALSTANAKNSCYELTRPSSLRRTPTSSSTVTVMTSGCGATTVAGGGGLTVPTVGITSLSDQHWPTRTLSVRHHHHFGASGSGTGSGANAPAASATNSPNLQAEATALTRHTRIQQQHHHHHAKSLSNRITSLKKENKTTQTLSIVVGGFIACWLPFFVYYLITPFLEEHQVSRTLAKGLTWLGWFNSAINPFIYAFYSVDFRAAFWRLTCKRFFSVSMKPQFPATTMSIRR